MYRVASLIIFFIATSLSSFAQQNNRFSLSGQIRHRTEVDARDFSSNTDDIWFHLLRTRVGLGISAAPDVTGFIQLQDSRVFGSENPSFGRGTLDGSAENIDLHQAYFKVDGLFGSPFSVKIGRQELAYGNQRLIGSVGWSNIGRSFDAGVLSYQGSKLALDIFLARLVGSTTNPYGQNLQGAYAVWPVDKNLSLEGFVVFDNNTEKLIAGPDEGESLLQRVTIGGTGRGDVSSFDYVLEAMYQGGALASSDSTARSDISASLLSGGLGFSWPNRSRLGLQYTVLSGDKRTLDGELNAFNTLFATNHKFYGFMDFYPRLLFDQGLHDLVVSFSFIPLSQLQLHVDFHHFMLDKSRTNEDILGQEIDVTSTFRYNDNFTLQAGASVFLSDDAMILRTGDDDPAFWFYLMTAFNF